MRMTVDEAVQCAQTVQSDPDIDENDSRSFYCKMPGCNADVSVDSEHEPSVFCLKCTHTALDDLAAFIVDTLNTSFPSGWREPRVMNVGVGHKPLLEVFGHSMTRDEALGVAAGIVRCALKLPAGPLSNKQPHTELNMSDDPLPLDDYEAVNLLWLLGVARRIGLDTGDWLGQLTRKLEMRGHGSVSEPNSPPSDTELRLREAARKIMASEAKDRASQ